MTIDNKKEWLAGCPICKNKNTGAFEFAKPAVLLCDCDRCGKYIVRRETFLRLARKNIFNGIRYNISDLIEKHFRQYGTPLQIISYTEKPLVQDAITIGKLISLCQEESKPEEAPKMSPEFRLETNSKSTLPPNLNNNSDSAILIIQNVLKNLFSNIPFGRHEKQVSYNLKEISHISDD